MNDPFDPGALLVALGAAQAEVVLIGGLALVSRGIIRPTADVDVCYRASKDNSVRMIAALHPFHPRLRVAPTVGASVAIAAFRFDARTLQEGHNLTLSTDAGPLDLLAHVPGLGGYEQVHAAATTLDLYDVSISVLDLEGLLRAKRAAGRSKDLLAIPDLEALLALRERTQQEHPAQPEGEP